MPIVVNIPGTENIKCTCCKTWLDHWKKHSKKSDPGKCRMCGTEDAVSGGHVKRLIGDRGQTFIVPVCEECGKKKQAVSFLVAQKDFVYAGACFEDIEETSDFDDTEPGSN